MDRNQLLKEITDNLAAKTTLTLPQFTALINSADAADKEIIMAAVNTGDGAGLSRVLDKLIKAAKFLLAQAAVNKKINADKISINDLVELLK